MQQEKPASDPLADEPAEHSEPIDVAATGQTVVGEHSTTPKKTPSNRTQRKHKQKSRIAANFGQPSGT